MNLSLTTAIKSLPPLSESVIQIQKLCANPDSSLQDITRIVEKDPMLTANILKAANSPLYGFSREVTSVAQAVSLFGMATILGFAVSSAIKNTIKVDISPYGTTEEKFAQVSMLQSALAAGWVGRFDRAKLQILSPASFLQETGKVVIAMILANEGKGAAFKEALKSHPIEKVEEEFAGVTSAEAAAELFTLWKFDQKMVETIRYSNHPENASPEIAPYAKILYVIKKAVDLDGTITDQTVQSTLEAASLMGFETSLLANELTKLRERATA